MIIEHNHSTGIIKYSARSTGELIQFCMCTFAQKVLILIRTFPVLFIFSIRAALRAIIIIIIILS